MVYELSENKNVNMKVTNLTNGQEIKAIYINESKINCPPNDLRIFFGGNEIKDDHILAQYNIDNDYKIIAIKKYNHL